MAIGVVLLALLATVSCSRTPAEQQVRAAISSAASAVGDTDAGALADVLSVDFDGNEGRFDRQRLLGMLRMQHLRGRSVGVLVGPVTIERRGERLLANFTVTLSGGQGVLPDELGVYSLRTAWKDEGGTWRCYNATWKRKV